MITKRGVTVIAGGAEIYHGFDWYFGLALARQFIDHRNLYKVVVYDSRNGGRLAILTSDHKTADITLPDTWQVAKPDRTYSDFMKRIRAALKEL